MLAGAAYMSVQASRGRMLPRREQLSWLECAALLVRGAVVLSPADATVALLASRGARAAGSAPLALPDVGFGVLNAALALVAYCVWFVVTNFVLEAAFDFAHYWIHRTMHMSPVLYRHLHARHHLHTRPVALCLLEQSMGEYWLASTVLPCAFAQVVARYVRSAGSLRALRSWRARVLHPVHCDVRIGPDLS
jgi:sterol desaturase/sphingolipid hydroxylase (fatty acid hydroxylase superfamily)